MNDLAVKDSKASSAEVSVEEIKKSALFQNLTFDDVDAMIERDEYLVYVNKALAKANDKSKRLYNIDIDVTANDLINELQVWAIPGFIWPSIFPNHEGGLVLFWKVGPFNVRFERSRIGTYNLMMWHSEHILNKKAKPVVNNVDIINETLPAFYYEMIKLMNDSGKEWKHLFLDRL